MPYAPEGATGVKKNTTNGIHPLDTDLSDRIFFIV
jgi:hypothetical protein